MSPPDRPTMVPDLSRRLRDDGFLLGSWLTILDSTVAELMAGAGFDLLVADGEHGPVATSDLVQMLVASRAAGVPGSIESPPMSPFGSCTRSTPERPAWSCPRSGRSPMPSAQSRGPLSAVRPARIAPRRASDYGRRTAEYLGTANDRVVCCIQIETHEALADLDAILAVPGIDTILIGPNDLSAALGHLGDLGHADVETAIATVLERAIAPGIPAGIWTASVAQARGRREQGFRWATLGTDYGFMAAGPDAAARDVSAP